MSAIRFTRRDVLVGGTAWAGALLLAGPGRAAAPPAPGAFALGIQSFTLRTLALEPMLDAVAALGLHDVELIPETKLLFWEFGNHLPVTADDTALAALHAALDARAIRLAASGVHGVSNGEDAERLFSFAQRARIPLLTIDPAEEALAPLDALCAANPDVRLGIHNHGPYFRYDTIDDVERALAGRHPGFGACVDTGHFIRSGEDPVEALRRLGPRVHGVHLKDFREAGLFASGCILGEGRLDLDACLRTLREIDFGPEKALSLEYEDDPDDPIPDVEACVRAVREAEARVASG